MRMNQKTWKRGQAGSPHNRRNSRCVDGLANVMKGLGSDKVEGTSLYLSEPKLCFTTKSVSSLL